MVSIQPRTTYGPDTYEAVEVIEGGQLVEARTGGVDNPGAGVAGDQSTKVLGVAQTTATPGGGDMRAMQAGVIDLTLAPVEFAAVNIGRVLLSYASACAYGTRVVAAADGKVKPYVAGTHTADMIVGRCVAKDGVAANESGFTRINL